MFRYVAYYKYNVYTYNDNYDYDDNGDYVETDEYSNVSLDEDEIKEINELFDTDENLNPMINKVFHECVGEKRYWKEVPIEMDTKIKGWNWKIKDSERGYVEILSEEPLTQEELDIMMKETEGQISDGYNENPFEFDLNDGSHYSIIFNSFPISEFKEE